MLISKDTLALMKPGSVVVAATSGGNVEDDLLAKPLKLTV